MKNWLLSIRLIDKRLSLCYYESITAQTPYRDTDL